MTEAHQPDAYDEAVSHRLGGSFRRRHPVTGGDEGERAVANEMRRNRRAKQGNQMSRTSAGYSANGGGSADIGFATGRPRDPMFYWRQNNLPFEVGEEDALKRIRAFMRILYMTHPYLPSCIDIYSKYPLLGMELRCKDEQLTEFHENLFFAERAEGGLDYKNFLRRLGREYWTVGEAWPFGSFNETLGVWEDDELLNPDDINIERDPFIKEDRYLIKLPKTLRDIITSRSPRWQFEKLMKLYPELQQYAQENARMPVSGMLLRQLKFEADTFNPRGIPIMLRGLRTVMQEEMLNAAMDAVADRLYTPLILVKLGASAQDLGTTVPWIPNDDDLGDFEEALDAALAADFRVIIHNFAVDMAPVFGRENMPNLDLDFERIEDRLLQIFGLSRTMLSGASGGETYAADALNRDLISQLLTTYQDLVKSHYRQRALIVAEAQEHYDYDIRGGKRYVKMEEIYEVDEETGVGRIVEQPKLLIPDLHMKTMNLADEQSERQFIEALAEGGVPISYRTRLTNIPIDFDDEIEQRKDEAVKLAVAEQQTRKEQYKALRAEGLPIPQDLKDDFEPKAAGVDPDQGVATQGQPTPVLGQDPMVTDTPNLAPTPEDLQQDQPGMTPGQMGQVIPMPGAQRPPESDEARGGMPKPARLSRTAHRIQAATEEHFTEPQVYEEDDLESRQVHGRLFGHPKHVGMRRYAVTEEMKGKPMEDWDQETA